MLLRRFFSSSEHCEFRTYSHCLELLSLRPIRYFCRHQQRSSFEGRVFVCVNVEQHEASLEHPRSAVIIAQFDKILVRLCSSCNNLDSFTFHNQCVVVAKSCRVVLAFSHAANACVIQKSHSFKPDSRSAQKVNPRSIFCQCKKNS